MNQTLSCYDPSTMFAPQWKYPPAPAGFYYEPYFVPFSFMLTGNTNPVYRIPIQLDDDFVFLARTLIFPAAGNSVATLSNPPESGVPLLLRLWDTRGNPLSNELALAFGVMCQSGFGGNGFGFPFPCEVRCDPGGLMQLDFQSPAIGGSSAPTASFTDTDSGETITFTAPINSGGARVFFSTQSGANAPLHVMVSGFVVTLVLGNDGAGTHSTTFTQARNALNGDSSAAALFTTSIAGPAPNAVVPPFGGDFGLMLTSSDVPTSLTGYVYGVRVRRSC